MNFKNHIKIIYRYYLNFKGPTDHIISVGKKCNNLCKYCITNASSLNNLKLSYRTAKNIIDFIFTIPQNYYYIEFTGGEPFENFEVLKKTVNYAEKKAQKVNKKIHFSVVSNLIKLTEEELKFILKHKITICTSIDGPKELHNTLRSPNPKTDNYSKTIKNLKKIIYYAKKGLIEFPNVITTVTKYSLRYPREIIDEYVNLGINRIQLGFIEPFGLAKENWEELGYSYNNYVKFYKKSINYMFELNKKYHIPVYEKGLLLIAYDILNNQKPRQRSIDIYHRLAYDFKGNIYPSDEARIIGETGNKKFIIGNTENDDFNSLVKRNKTKLFMLSNFQELIQPLCLRCKYVNYCKIGSYYNYITQNSIFGNMITNQRCKLFKEIFKFTKQLLKNNKHRNIVENWIRNHL